MKGWRKIAGWLAGSSETDGRDWAVFLLSLLLAFSVWFIHNLGQVYISEVSVPVRAGSSIEGRASNSSNTVDVTAVCRTSGFNYVRLNWYLLNHTRKITLDASQLRYAGGDSYLLVEKELQDVAHQIYGEAFKVDQFITDTVVFHFPAENCKKVPVEFVGDLGCKSQYTISSPIRLEPDSVMVYGRPEILKDLNSVRTESVIKMDLARDVKSTARLRRIKDVRISCDNVKYSADVTRFVELTYSYPLKVHGAPEGKELIMLPSEVSISFMCPFPLEADPRESAVFYVDYKDFEESYGGKCLVRIDRELPGVIRWYSQPDMVECVVKE